MYVISLSRTPHEARENRRVSTDFRRGFNQKIIRMDEALQQFSETQSAFCKELRDNLGARLEKRGLELGALSEQVAALVRTSTEQVAMLETLTSDHVSNNSSSSSSSSSSNNNCSSIIIVTIVLFWKARYDSNTSFKLLDVMNGIH